MMKSILSGAALIAATLAFSAAPTLAQVYVQIGPPAPVVETIPPAPAGQVWVPGYYNYSGGHYVWLHGHYAHPANGYKHWCAGRWHHGPHGYWWSNGHWC